MLTALLLALVAPLTQPGAATAAPLDAAAVSARVEPGLVQITTMNDFQGIIGNGTGIVLSPEGEVLTNHHVVQGANSIRATLATGQVFDADVLGYDRDDDVALLRLRGAGGLTPAPLGDSNTVALGDPVITLGNANGTGAPLTHEQGAVTALAKTISAEDELTGSSHSLGGLIESSTNLRSGDSGGALVNSAGQVVGMNAAATINFRLDGESEPGGQGYAIPINRALDIANQIRAGAASPEVHIGPSAMLGVGIDANGRSRSGGLPIRSLLRGGPADLAGLRAGDIIMSIDGVPISSANDLTDLLDQRYPGNVIDVNWIDRAGTPFNGKVTLTPGPVS
ncbi:S1C family serine protease [Mycobacterium sp. ACS4331]|uniref:S1C family serine protease n=1 Tax=Mycobacterium sp. ACS4331 TaxID=1834121 RepID=UPI00336A8915